MNNTGDKTQDFQARYANLMDKAQIVPTLCTWFSSQYKRIVTKGASNERPMSRL